MTTLLLRHTRVAVDSGVCYGTSDVGLAESFPQELALVRARLGPFRGVVVSSPLRRCLTLARSLAPCVRVDARLREYDFGQWELCRWEDIPRSEIEAWNDDMETVTPPGGERLDAFVARCEAGLQEARRLAGREPLLLCVHAGVIRALLGRKRGLEPRAALALEVAHGGIYDLDTGAAYAAATPAGVPAKGGEAESAAAWWRGSQ